MHDRTPATDAESPVSGPARPRIHASFLVVFGLTGVAYSGLSILDLSHPGVRLGMLVPVVTAWLMNAAWLTVVAKDGANVLGTGITVGPTRAFMLAIFSCFAFPAWSTMVVTWIARDTLGRLAGLNRVHLVPGLPRAVRHGGEVMLVFIVWLVIEIVIQNRVQEATRIEGLTSAPVSQIEALGLSGALLATAFRIGGTLYVLQFLARSVPVLYEAFSQLTKLRAARTEGASQGSAQ